MSENSLLVVLLQKPTVTANDLGHNIIKIHNEILA